MTEQKRSSSPDDPDQSESPSRFTKLNAIQLGGAAVFLTGSLAQIPVVRGIGLAVGITAIFAELAKHKD